MKNKKIKTNDKEILNFIKKSTAIRVITSQANNTFLKMLIEANLLNENKKETFMEEMVSNYIELDLLQKMFVFEVMLRIYNKDYTEWDFDILQPDEFRTFLTDLFDELQDTEILLMYSCYSTLIDTANDTLDIIE